MRHVENGDITKGKKVLNEEIKCINFLRKEINDSRRGSNGKIIKPATGPERDELRKLRKEKKKYTKVKKHINAILKDIRS